MLQPSNRALNADDPTSEGVEPLLQGVDALLAGLWRRVRDWDSLSATGDTAGDARTGRRCG